MNGKPGLNKSDAAPAILSQSFKGRAGLLTSASIYKKQRMHIQPTVATDMQSAQPAYRLRQSFVQITSNLEKPYEAKDGQETSRGRPSPTMSERECIWPTREQRFTAQLVGAARQPQYKLAKKRAGRHRGAQRALLLLDCMPKHNCADSRTPTPKEHDLVLIGRQPCLLQHGQRG